MLTQLTDPLFLALFVGLLGLGWLTRVVDRSAPRVRRALMLAWLGFGCLWLASSPWFASLGLRSLQPEPTQLEPQLAGKPVSERALVVLSAGPRNVYDWLPPAETLDGDSQGRIIGAARAYHAHGFEYVVVTGIHAEFVQGMADLLVQLGVPRERILLDPHAQSTRDNAEHSCRILRERNIKLGVVVTSATHMPRALRLFRGKGLEVVGFPVAYESGLSWRLLPSATALRRTDLVLHEYLGLLAEVVRGG